MPGCGMYDKESLLKNRQLTVVKFQMIFLSVIKIAKVCTRAPLACGC